MTNQLLGLFSSIEAMLKFSLIMAVVIGIVFIVIYIPPMRPVFAVVAFVALLFFGGYTLYYDIKYMTANSITIGDVFETVFKQTEVEETDDKPDSTSWSFTNVAFKVQNNGTYMATITLSNNEVVDFENNGYVVLINNEECFANENGGSLSNPYIKSQFAYDFYDEHCNLLLSDTLYINFSFYANETLLKISTLGGDNAVRLWNAFKAKNGLVLSLKETEKFETNKSDIVFDNIELESGTYLYDKFCFVIDMSNLNFEFNYDSNFISSGTIETDEFHIFLRASNIDTIYYLNILSDNTFSLTDDEFSPSVWIFVKQNT